MKTLLTESHLKKIMPCDLFDLKLGQDIKTIDYNFNNCVVHLNDIYIFYKNVNGHLVCYKTNNKNIEIEALLLKL
jgi:hypothetical protein